MSKIIPLTLLLAILLWVACAGPLNAVPEASETAAASLRIMSAEEWGATPFLDSLPAHRITHITIHHGGEDFPADKDPIAYLRALQSWSRSEKHWMDIPYHYMIDLQGQIYEARPLRFPGDTNTDYDVRGHALICVMGNYEHQTLSAFQFEQMAKLTALLADSHGVDASKIKSHKDYTETLCPGKDIYGSLEDGSFLKRVAELRQ